MGIPYIRSRIFEIRNQKVILDYDLAGLYEVETRILNQAVKRNIDRFPEDFMFRLTPAEWHTMRSQIVIAYAETTENQLVEKEAVHKKRNKAVIPYAFTEHGVAMLSSVLRNEKAVQMNIAIVRAFVALKKEMQLTPEITAQLQELHERLGEHDVQLNSIYNAIEDLLDEKQEEKSWEDRERIGFKTGF